MDDMIQWIRRNFFTKLELFNGVLDSRYYTEAEVTALLAGTWTGVTFNTGWGNTGSGNQTCQYKKVGDLVFLRGLATRSSGVATTMFTLPAGYRPPADDRYPALTDAGGHAAVTIDTSGNVAYVVGSPADYISVSGIFFSTV